jgi:hypothetical protein
MLVGTISLGRNFCNFGFHLSGTLKMVRKATHLHFVHSHHVTSGRRWFLCLFQLQILWISRPHKISYARHGHLTLDSFGYLSSDSLLLLVSYSIRSGNYLGLKWLRRFNSKHFPYSFCVLYNCWCLDSLLGNLGDLGLQCRHCLVKFNKSYIRKHAMEQHD